MRTGSRLFAWHWAGREAQATNIPHREGAMLDRLVLWRSDPSTRIRALSDDEPISSRESGTVECVY